MCVFSDLIFAVDTRNITAVSKATSVAFGDVEVTANASEANLGSDATFLSISAPSRFGDMFIHPAVFHLTVFFCCCFCCCCLLIFTVLHIVLLYVLMVLRFQTRPDRRPRVS